MEIIENNTQSVNTPEKIKKNTIYKAIPKDSPLSLKRDSSKYASYGNHLIEDLLPLTAICYTHCADSDTFTFDDDIIYASELRTSWIQDMRFSNDVPAMARINDGDSIYAVSVRAALNPDNIYQGYSGFVSIQGMLRQIYLPWPNIISEVTSLTEKDKGFTELVWVLEEPVKRGSEEHDQIIWAVKQIVRIIYNRFNLRAAGSEDIVAWNLPEGVPGIWQYRNRDYAYKCKEFVSKIKTMVHKMGYGGAMDEVRAVCRAALKEHPFMENRRLIVKAVAKAKQVLRENKHIYPDYVMAEYGTHMPVIHGKKTEEMLNYDIEDFDPFLFHETKAKSPIRPEAIIMEGEFYKKIIAMTKKTANEVYALHVKKCMNGTYKAKDIAETKPDKQEYHLGNTLITNEMRKKAGNNRASRRALEESREMRSEKKKKRMLDALTLRNEGHSLSKIAERLGVTSRQVVRWFAELKKADSTGSATELALTIENSLEKNEILNYVYLSTSFNRITVHTQKKMRYLTRRDPNNDPLSHYKSMYKEEVTKVLARQCARIAKGEDLGVINPDVQKMMMDNIPRAYFKAGAVTSLVYYLDHIRTEIYKYCFGWLDFAKNCRIQENGMLRLGTMGVLGCSDSLKESVDELTVLFEKAIGDKINYALVTRTEQEYFDYINQALTAYYGGERPDFSIIPDLEQENNRRR